MSRKSLLDEAITKAKEAEDWQLVEWLRMARGGESAARWYSDKLREAHRTERKLLDENAKLRELVRDYERCTMHAGCSRCEYDGKLSVHCPFSPCFPDTDELYELGVEVSDA